MSRSHLPASNIPDVKSIFSWSIARKRNTLIYRNINTSFASVICVRLIIWLAHNNRFRGSCVSNDVSHQFFTNQIFWNQCRTDLYKKRLWRENWCSTIKNRISFIDVVYYFSYSNEWTFYCDFIWFRILYSLVFTENLFFIKNISWFNLNIFFIKNVVVRIETIQYLKFKKYSTITT